jgi:hypothetical protein
MMRIFISILLLISLGVFPALAEEQIEIFPLKYRSATEVLKQVKPLLLEGERASAAEKHLVLIASPLTIDAVNQLITLLDRPLRQFLVQIRWIDSVAHTKGGLGYDARSGLATMPSQGKTVGTSGRQSGQQLTVLEGEGALVVTGRDIPYSARWSAWSGKYGKGFSSKTSFQKIRSGFWIIVSSISDDQLLVDVTPQLMAAGQGSMLKPATITLDRLTTQIRTKPGKWLDLAAFLPDSGVGTRILAGSENPLPSGRRIQLRIAEQK